MGSKKQEQFETYRELELLIQRLLKITEDYFFNRKKFTKDKDRIWDGAKTLKGRKGEQYFLLSDKLENTTNAFLVYSFSLYEIYASNLLKHLIKTNKKINHIYESKWDKLFNEIKEGKHQNLDISSNIYRNKKLRIDSYSILLRTENKTLNNFLRDLQGINKVSIDNEIISRYICEYSIYRESRNMLTHRGTELDNIFFNSLKSNTDIKRNKEAYEEFLANQFKRLEILDGKKTKSINQLVGQQINLRFMSVRSSIIFNAVWHSLDHTNNHNQHDDSLGSIFHDILKFSTKNDEYEFLKLIVEIFNVYKECRCNGDVSKIHDIDKFNYFLTNDLLKTALLKLTRGGKAKNGKTQNKIIRNIYDLKLKSDLENNFQFSLLKDDMQQLLLHHIKNEKSKFYKVLQNLQISNEEISTWFIFDKYRKDQKFINISKTKHNSKGYFD